MAANVRFYRLDKLPDFGADGKHVGLFVYVPEYTLANGTTWTRGYSATTGQGVTYTFDTNSSITVNAGTKVLGGLWFGGRLGWEHLTNVGSGISWDEIYNWFDTHVAGEAEIFAATQLTNGTGTKITIYDPVLDRNGQNSQTPGTFGLHASTDTSDTHEFIVGDGALKLTGNKKTLNNDNSFAVEGAFDIHSANDTADNTLTLDDSLYVTKGSENGDPSTATIGVRTNQNVTATNPVATMADLAGLTGAMHLVGTLDAYSDTSVGAEHIWPNQTGSHWITSGTPVNTQVLLKAGDTFIVTTAHDGPNDNTGTGNTHYEVGDMVLFYNGGTDVGLTYKVVNQNITTGVNNGQHAPVDMAGGLVENKLVIATQNGIATTDAQISDFVTGVTTTQTIADTAPVRADEDQTHTTTYTVTTTITRPDGADSDANPDTAQVSHNLVFHSNNNSLTIQEGTTDAEHQINFDLVWLTTMV